MARPAAALAVCALALVGALAGACGGDDERALTLVRIPGVDAACGAPADARTLRVRALGDFAPGSDTAVVVPLGGDALEVRSFPAATRVVTVELLGAGAEVVAVGQTAPFAMDELADGDELAVFMGPPRGFCPTGPPSVARARPLVARAGAGALVVGGVGAGGAPERRVEWYDPERGVFVDLDEGGAYAHEIHGRIGASLTAMDDGPVLLAGGAVQAYQLYDPAQRSFGPALFLPIARARHAAATLGGGRVLLAGGCSQLDGDGGCLAGSILRTTTVLDLATGAIEDGPSLALERIDGDAIVEADGRVLLVGGVGPDGDAVLTAERLDPRAGPGGGALVAAAGGRAAPLAAGGALAAFGPGGAPRGEAAVVPPGQPAAVAVGGAGTPRAGATLTALPGGQVLVVGGLGGGLGEAALYRPVETGFLALPGAPSVARHDHGAALLDDGTVLVVGGAGPDGEPLADAWIFRPELVGPFSPDATVIFGDSELSQRIVPSDPARARRVVAAGDAPTHYLLESRGAAGGLPSVWAVVAGPVFPAATVSTRVRADEGGLSVLLGFRSSAEFLAVTMVPGELAALVRVGEDGGPVSGCSRRLPIEDGDLDAGDAVDVVVEARADRVRALLDGREVLACDLLDPLPRGAIGLGVIGPSTARLRIDSIRVER